MTSQILQLHTDFSTLAKAPTVWAELIFIKHQLSLSVQRWEKSLIDKKKKRNVEPCQLRFIMGLVT